MDKRRDTTSGKAEKKPMAAEPAEVQRVIRRLEAMDLNTEEAVTRGARISHATYFRFKNGAASVAKVRDIDEWAAREEQKRRVPSAGTKSQRDELLAEWATLGETLLEADPERFKITMDGIRDMLEAARLQQRAIAKMFRATPEPER